MRSRGSCSPDSDHVTVHRHDASVPVGQEGRPAVVEADDGTTDRTRLPGHPTGGVVHGRKDERVGARQCREDLCARLVTDEPHPVGNAEPLREGDEVSTVGALAVQVQLPAVEASERTQCEARTLPGQQTPDEDGAPAWSRGPIRVRRSRRQGLVESDVRLDDDPRPWEAPRDVVVHADHQRRAPRRAIAPHPPSSPAAGRTEHLGHDAAEAEPPHEPQRLIRRSADGPPDERDPVERGQSARLPVRGERDMVRDVESDLRMQPAREARHLPLPQDVVPVHVAM